MIRLSRAVTIEKRMPIPSCIKRKGISSGQAFLMQTRSPYTQCRESFVIKDLEPYKLAGMKIDKRAGVV